MNKFIKHMSFFALALMLLPLASSKLVGMDAEDAETAAVVGDGDGGSSSKKTDSLAAAVVVDDAANRGSSSARGRAVQRRRHPSRGGHRKGGGNAAAQHNAMSSTLHDDDAGEQGGAEGQEDGSARVIVQRGRNFISLNAHATLVAATMVSPGRRQQYLEAVLDARFAEMVSHVFKVADNFAQPEAEDGDEEEGSSNGEGEEGEAEIDTTMALNVAKLITYLGQRNNDAINQLSNALFSDANFLRHVIIAAHQNLPASGDAANIDSLQGDQGPTIKAAAGRAIAMLSSQGHEALNVDEIVGMLEQQFQPNEMPFVLAVVLQHARVSVDMQNAKQPQAHTSNSRPHDAPERKNLRSCCPTCKEVACCCCGSAMGAATVWATQNAEWITAWVTTQLSLLGLS